MSPGDLLSSAMKKFLCLCMKCVKHIVNQLINSQTSMPTKLLLTFALVILIIFPSEAQLIANIGYKAGIASGLDHQPYKSGNLTNSGYMGLFQGELGYRFSDKVSFRMYYAAGEFSKPGTDFEGYLHRSFVQEVGIKPSFKLHDWRRSLLELDITGVAGWTKEKVEWRDAVSQFGIGTRASGVDHAYFFHAGLGPTARLNLRKPKFFFEASLLAIFYKLNQSKRLVEYQQNPGYDNSQHLDYRPITLAIQVSAGYRFW